MACVDWLLVEKIKMWKAGIARYGGERIEGECGKDQIRYCDGAGQVVKSG